MKVLGQHYSFKSRGLDIWVIQIMTGDFSGGTVVKNLPAKAGDAGDTALIPGLERPPGGGNGNPLQYFCLGNPMDRGGWWATVHGVTKSQTLLSMHTHLTFTHDIPSA